MINIENLNHHYKNKSQEVLKNINLHIRKGENVVLIGSSGCGKTTLLRSINRLIEPVSGSIHINGENILKMPIKKVVRIRGKIGMIFQNFNLIERDSVLKNTLNGRLRHHSSLNTLFGRFSTQDYEIAKQSLKRVGLEDYENERINNLSGGQKQRVAIARTLSQNPDIILADEPVSSLDPKLMREILELLNNICLEKEITLVTSLHFLELAKKYSSRIIGMRQGELIFDGKPEELTDENIIKIYGETGF